MPLPPLSSHRSPEDSDARAGRRGSVASSRGPAGSSGAGAADSGPSGVDGDGLSGPALLSDEGRRVVTTLNGVRDEAGRLWDALSQLEAAGAGVARVEKLIGRLRDITVVAIDAGLQPADRAALQREIDLALGEIDTTSEETQVDEGLLRLSGPSVRGRDEAPRQPVPLRAIGTASLGLTDLAVRSSDQAVAASGALEIASARLQRSAGQVDGALVRLQDRFTELTSPVMTATGGPALVGDTAAQTSTMLLRRQLLSHPEQAADAQAGLDASRVRWLIDAEADA